MFRIKEKVTAPHGFQSIDEHEPVFREPWEAHVFALAIQFYNRGIFSWIKWTEALTSEMVKGERCQEIDCGDTYYHYWLNTLVKLLIEKGL